VTYAGNYRLGDLFSSRREKGRAGLPTLSVTLNDGLVTRDDLDRKQDTNLSPEEHLLVKPGDIAYNMMRMWQGAFGLADCEGLVSPAYVVLEANAGVDPQYASYLFETKRMAYLFWAYSYGITDDRLRLYYPDFAQIRVTVPPRQVQKRLSSVLLTWDRAEAVIQKLIANSQMQKAALATQLLTPGDRTLRKMSRHKRLRDLVDIEYGRSPLGIRDEAGLFPIVGTGGLVGLSSKYLAAGPSVVIGRKGSISKPQFIQDNFWPIDTTFYCKAKSGCNLKWFYHRLSLIDLNQYNEASGVPSLSRSTIEEISFEVPDFEEQCRVARILDSADVESEKYVALLRNTTMQRSALLQRLYVRNFYNISSEIAEEKVM